MNAFENRHSFEDETFAELDLRKVSLSDREFVRCVFRGCKLSETRWQRTRLEECAFEGCDLTQAEPAGLSLRDVEFKRCKLMGIDWSHLGTFPTVSFEDCNFQYATMVSIALRKTRFTRCAMVEANFLSSDFAESVFEDCRFTGARFEGCDVRKASFAGAQDLFLDPATNNVKGARVPVESAVLLAASRGMHVFGYSDRKGKGTSSSGRD